MKGDMDFLESNTLILALKERINKDITVITPYGIFFDVSLTKVDDEKIYLKNKRSNGSNESYVPIPHIISVHFSDETETEEPDKKKPKRIKANNILNVIFKNIKSPLKIYYKDKSEIVSFVGKVVDFDTELITLEEFDEPMPWYLLYQRIPLNDIVKICVFEGEVIYSE
jgi:hypothetical protein